LRKKKEELSLGASVRSSDLMKTNSRSSKKKAHEPRKAAVSQTNMIWGVRERETNGWLATATHICCCCCCAEIKQARPESFNELLEYSLLLTQFALGEHHRTKHKSGPGMRDLIMIFMVFL